MRGVVACRFIGCSVLSLSLTYFGWIFIVVNIELQAKKKNTAPAGIRIQRKPHKKMEDLLEGLSFLLNRYSSSDHQNKTNPSTLKREGHNLDGM